VGSRLVDSGGINVTWLIHDVQVWRVDRVYLDGDAPVVATQSNVSGGSVFDVAPVWHRPSNPRDLTALLNDLKLGAPGGPPAAVPSPVATAAPATLERAQTQVAATTGSGSSGLFWGSAGALLGAGLVLGLGRLRGTRRQEPDETPDPDLPASVDVITSGR
jgi:hypothetical protein